MTPSIYAIIALVALVGAVPHARHQHQREHQHHQHAKREVVDVVTDIVVETTAAVIVYVNGQGQPISTSYLDQDYPSTSSSIAAITTPVAEAAVTTTASSTSIAVAAETAETTSTEAATSSVSAAATPSSDSSSSSSTSSDSNALSLGYGLSYSAYNGDSSCKTAEQVNQDFADITGYDYIRIYGSDCDQVTNALNVARAKNMSVFASIYDVTQVATEAQQIIEAAQNDWDLIHSIAVGNEAATTESMVPVVVSAVSQARSLLNAAGYTGNIVAVNVFSDILQWPELCEVSDYTAANCHAFFDADATAETAGAYVKQQAEQLAARCNKTVVITESGWPSAGDTNGAAVPSPENQATAIGSLRSAFSDNLVLFSAYNDYWKTNNAGTFGAEQYWGIYGNGNGPDDGTPGGADLGT